MSDVLVLRAGALGDVLLLRRAVAALRRSGRRVTLLAPREPGSALVGPGPSEADDLLPWDRPEMASLLVQGGHRAPWLSRTLERYVLAVAYTRSADIVANLQSLVPTVIAHDPQPPPADGHASLWLASALAGLGVETQSDPSPCVPTAEEEELARPWTERLPPGFLAVHPGSGSPAKNWPVASFAALVEAARMGGDWLLVQGPADEASASPLRPLAGAVLASNVSPRTLGAVLARAGAYVGNDSGTSHLAAAWGAPTVALFGPTDPAMWAPVGPQVHVMKAPGPSMSAIAVDDVLALVRRLRGAG